MGVAAKLRSIGLPVATALPLTLLLLGSPATPAQTMTGAEQTETSPYLEPLPDEGEAGEGPSVAFRVTTEIGLPGPLPGAGPRLVDDRLLTPVDGGTAISGWTEDTEVSILPGAEPPTESDPTGEPLWAVAPDGRIRVAALASGHVMAQKRCKRCKAGWRKKWKLRQGSVADSIPLVTDERVFFGALDNRVYSVRRKNGHRMWEFDVEGRPSRSLERWQGAILGEGQDDSRPWEGEPLDVVLVIPDHGREILALDAESGSKVASYRLPEDEGRLIGAPVLTPDGKIVVAREKYAREDASLMVFDLVKPTPSGAPAGPDI